MRSMALALMLGALSVGGTALAQGGPKGPPAAAGQGGPGCPCMQGGGMGAGPMMMGQANVTVENTSGGAVMRFTAKDPSQVQTIQKHAQMMATCMGGGAAAQPPARMPPK